MYWFKNFVKCRPVCRLTEEVAEVPTIGFLCFSKLDEDYLKNKYSTIIPALILGSAFWRRPTQKLLLSGKLLALSNRGYAENAEMRRGRMYISA